MQMEDQNPWWYGEPDREFEEWKSKPLKWIPPIIKEFNFKPFSLNFIVGPRQVGKTTTLKIYIHELLESTNPKSIFYLSCEEVTNFRELGEIIDNYLSFRKMNKINSSFIILDEITFVEEWYRAIKARIDKGLFKNDVLIISGSASLQLLKQKEHFPGRRGYGKDIIFYPLSFSDYVSCFKNLQTSKESLERIEAAMEANKIHSQVLVKSFENYIETGGFPLSILDFFTYGRVTYETKKAYIDWLKSDFMKLNRDEGYMKEVLSFIISAQAVPISWLNISRETSIASPHTAKAYVEDLKNMFVVEILNFLSPEGKVISRKNKKIHVLDPFLYKVICDFTRTQPNEGALLEGIVATHLSRRYETFYWKNGTEVDIVVRLNRKQIGIEVKKSVQTWRKPLHLHKSILLTKTDIPLFLASIG